MIDLTLMTNNKSFRREWKSTFESRNCRHCYHCLHCTDWTAKNNSNICGWIHAFIGSILAILLDFVGSVGWLLLLFYYQTKRFIDIINHRWIDNCGWSMKTKKIKYYSNRIYTIQFNWIWFFFSNCNNRRRKENMCAMNI